MRLRSPKPSAVRARHTCVSREGSHRLGSVPKGHRLRLLAGENSRKELLKIADVNHGQRDLIMKLTSNTILITGGGSGIGYELTKQLTALGNTILITGPIKLRWTVRKRPFQNSAPFEATFPIRKRSPLFTKRSPNNFLSSTF